MRKILTLLAIISSSLCYAQTAEDLYNQSLKELGSKNYEKGIELIDEFIEKYPNFENIHMIYLNRASAKSLIKDYDGALKDYTTAFEKNPKYAEALRQRGFLKKEMGKFENALKDYNLALEIDSTLGNIYVNKGIVLDTLGRKKEACLCYEKALLKGIKNAAKLLYSCDSNSVVLQKYEYKILVDKTKDKTYGYKVENPIKVGHGPRAQRGYLELLRDGKGKKIEYKRSGNAGMYESKNGFMGIASVDSYVIKYRDEKGKKKKTTLYISFYDYEQPKIPVGFYSIEDYK